MWGLTRKAQSAIFFGTLAIAHAFLQGLLFGVTSTTVVLAMFISIVGVLLWVDLNRRCWRGEPWIRRHEREVRD